jgi:glycerol-3-phosphate dehydrogenase (NAD(P)+)
LLPTQVIQDVVPQARVGVLTGPSFAADIAVGKPTALTLAMADADEEAIQALLSTSALRIYLSDDMIGAQLGGALKNVIAIAAGIVIGAGLGDSARAALMTRALAEMIRYAQKQGGRSETLFGLSGFGDLVLTCTSSQSRNFRHGAAFGEGIKTDENVTVEGVTTAHAVVEAMRTSASESRAEEDLPLTFMVSSLLKNEISLEAATDALLARPLRRE